MSSTNPLHEPDDTRSNVTAITDRLAEPPETDAKQDAASDPTDERASSQQQMQSPPHLSALGARIRDASRKNARWLLSGAAAIVVLGASAALIVNAPWTAGDKALKAETTAALSEFGARVDALEAVDQTTTSTLTDIRTSIEGAGAALRRLTADVSTLEARLDTAEGRDADASQAIAAFRERLDGAQETISGLTSKIDDALASAQRRTPAASVVTLSAAGPTPAAAPARPTRLPFTPVTIDLWGGASQLTIETKDGFLHLAEGQTHRGWTFVNAERDDGVATLQDANGRFRRYVLGEGLSPLPSARQALQASATLTVETTPDDARIRVMNIKPVYAPGMPLSPGLYDIEVTAPGFAPHRQWIRIGDGAHEYQVTLDAETAL